MVLGILLSVSGILACSSHLFTWSFLVLGSLSVVCWLKTRVPSSALVLYFVISCLGGLLFLVSWTESWASSLVLQLSLLLKLGYAPFQFWVYKVLSPLSLIQLCFFLGPTKFGLLWLLVSISHSSLALTSASLLVGVLLLWLSGKSHLVLYASGSSHLLVLVLLGPNLFIIYHGIYLFSLLILSLLEFELISPVVAFAGLGGLPPLSMFWAKFHAIICSPLSISALILVVSMVLLWPYMRSALAIPSSSQTSILALLISSLAPIFFVSLY